MADLHALAGLTDRLEVDTSEGQPVYLLTTRNGRYLRLSPSAYTVLSGLHRGRSPADLAAELGRLQGSPVSPADVEAAYQHLLGRISAIEQQPDRLETGFWVRIRCLPAALVGRVARPLSAAFGPWAALGLAVLIGVAALLMPWHVPRHLADPATFWSAYLLFLLSLVAHEFGHAGACERYGAHPGDIGLTLYWIYPAFYCDVSAVWQLKRWQRAVVDVGGVFLQLVAGALYALGYIWSGWEPARLAVLMVLGSAVFSLNPLLKFDGYWLLADLLGVTNLSQQPRRIAQTLAARLRGRPAAPLPWPPAVMLAVGLYSVASVGFWGYVLRRVAPLLYQTALALPHTLAQLGGALQGPGHLPLAGQIQHLLLSLFVLLIGAMMLWRLLRPLAGALTAGLRRQLRRPAPRPQVG
jgi:putative peptide zinc metalloprotease protein